MHLGCDLQCLQIVAAKSLIAYSRIGYNLRSISEFGERRFWEFSAR
jgi:hypothetical protein